MKRLVQTLVLLATVALPAAAFAQNPLATGEEAKPELTNIPKDAQPAVDLLKKYLDAVKAKKWAEAKKLTHPRTLEAIAQRKKKLGNEDHPMAPWFYEKNQSYLKSYKLTAARPGPMDTWILETAEDNFQVEEKGISEGDKATYLLGKSGGKWFVTDKKRGVDITDDSVKFGYRGYFDAAAEGPAKGE